MEQTNEAVKKTGGARLKKDENVPKRRGKWIWIFLAVLAALLLGQIALGAYALRLDTFWPGSSVLRHDVSGLTAAEAAAKLETLLPETDLFIYYLPPEEDGDGKGYLPLSDPLPEDAPPHHTVLLSQLGIQLDAQVLAQAAFDAQRDISPLRAGRSYIAHHRTTRFSNFYAGDLLRLDPQKADAAAEAAAAALSQAPTDTSYALGDGSIRLQAPKDGIQIDTDALKENLRSMEWLADRTLKAGYAIAPAKALTAREIQDAVAGQVKNAGYDAKTGSIIPEQAAASFDVAAAQAALDGAAPGEVVELPADIQLPAVTAEELEKVLFRDVLGKARTRVGGTAARKSNVRLSAAAIDGFVMNTGDVFSYNGVVGQRTAANGYQAAPAYVKGETVDEIGGGICQTSSTLYLACLRSDLEITERYAHRYIPAYIPPGMDATVSWGGPDYKFTNDTDYPIKIVTSYEGGYLTVELLGTNVQGTSVKMTNESLSSTPFEVVYEDDPTLPAGTEKVKTTPYTGSKWRTYRNRYSADGKLLSSDYEATSDYKSRNKVILRGPALPADPVAPVDPSLPTVEPVPLPDTPQEPALPPEQSPETPGAPVVVLPDLPPSET